MSSTPNYANRWLPSAQNLQSSGFLRPGSVATMLFFLLFSGPPSFRIRNPEASLAGIIDPVIAVQASVWVIAGVWTLLEVRKFRKRNPCVPIGTPIWLGLTMTALLSLSIPLSPAPSLSAFKIGQLLVCISFAWVFVHLYGIVRSLRYMLTASLMLCAGIAISAVIAPALVFVRDEHGLRLRGDLIADTGIVATYAIMLLAIKKPNIRAMFFWPVLSAVVVLLALSLTREAWFVVLAFLVLFFIRRMRGALARKAGYTLLVSIPALFIFVLLPLVQTYRSTGSVWTLSDRTGLWFYLSEVTITRSPWIGLGYYSASRVFGPEYNPGLGTAHSMFIEVFCGGGIMSLIPLAILSLVLSWYALRLAIQGNTRLLFICGSLFFASLAFGAMGADFGSGPVGITFWMLAAAIPILREQTSSNTASRVFMRSASPI